jgi:hypothetical protein
MTPKQIREFRENINKHQSETQNTIKREIHELKRNTQIIKEELITYLENLRRINQRSWKLKVPKVKQKTQGKATPTD